MKWGAIKHQSDARLIISIVVALPMLFAACGSGIVAPGSTTQQSTAPTIASVVPDTGPLAGGTTVTIAGSNFSSGATVSFGGTPASNISFMSSTQLNATTPAHATGSVSVVVTNADGIQANLPSGFTYGSSSLAVNSVSPISGPAAGGTQVTISGSGFQSGASVTIGGFGAAAVTVSNSTTIQAQTPAHNAGSVSVTVTNPNGKSASLSSAFAYHSVDLLWSAPSSSTVAIVGYNVYRSMIPAGPFGKLNGPAPVGNTAFTDNTVQGSTTYYYEVTSVDSSGTESVPEGPVQATTPP